MLAGNGGAHLSPIAASDVNQTAQLTYEHRFKQQLKVGVDYHLSDIRDPRLLLQLEESMARRNLNEVDIVCGGPPCQGFALFGARDKADPRNDLFLHYLKAIEILRPSYFVMENVPGFVHMYEGNTVERMFEAVAALRSPRYTLAGPFIVNAAAYGVPQLRERVLFIGSRSDLRQVTAAPPPTCRTPFTVRDALGDLAFLRPWESAETYDPNWPADGEYQDESRQGRLHKRLDTVIAPSRLLNHEAARHSPEVIARFSLMRQGEGLESIPRPAWNRYLKTRKKWCVRLHEARPANTVVTLPDDLIHYGQPRILTVREAARLQSFDDTFGFLGPRATGGGGAGNKKRNQEVPQYTQVGNAVPPLLAKAIGDHLLSALGENREGTQLVADREVVAA